MRKLLCLFLIPLLIFSGCAIGRGRFVEPVTFYYLRDRSGSDTYDEFFSDGAIGSETREASGHRQDLDYLLALYLQGPLDEDLCSPFPYGARVLEIDRTDDVLTVSLNSVMAHQTDMELTIASACLAKTCMALSDASTVRVESRTLNGDVLFTRSFTGENLLLEDSNAQPSEATEESQSWRTT